MARSPDSTDKALRLRAEAWRRKLLASRVVRRQGFAVGRRMLEHGRGRLGAMNRILFDLETLCQSNPRLLPIYHRWVREYFALVNAYGINEYSTERDPPGSARNMGTEDAPAWLRGGDWLGLYGKVKPSLPRGRPRGPSPGPHRNWRSWSWYETAVGTDARKVVEDLVRVSRMPRPPAAKFVYLNGLKLGGRDLWAILPADTPRSASTELGTRTPRQIARDEMLALRHWLRSLGRTALEPVLVEFYVAAVNDSIARRHVFPKYADTVRDAVAGQGAIVVREVLKGRWKSVRPT